MGLNPRKCANRPVDETEDKGQHHGDEGRGLALEKQRKDERPVCEPRGRVW